MGATKVENHRRKLLQNYFHADISLFLQTWLKTYGWVVLCFLSLPWKWNSGVPLVSDFWVTLWPPLQCLSLSQRIERCHWCLLHVSSSLLFTSWLGFIRFLGGIHMSNSLRQVEIWFSLGSLQKMLKPVIESKVLMLQGYTSQPCKSPSRKSLSCTNEIYPLQRQFLPSWGVAMPVIFLSSFTWHHHSWISFYKSHFLHPWPKESQIFILYLGSAQTVEDDCCRL